MNFWASWCPPCVEEAASLESFAEQMGSHGVTVILNAPVRVRNDHSAEIYIRVKERLVIWLFTQSSTRPHIRRNDYDAIASLDSDRLGARAR